MTKTTTTTPTTEIVTSASLITKLKDIDKAMAEAKADTMTLSVKYQLIACSIVKHLGTNKDVRVLNRLFDSMEQDKQSALNVNSMRQFFILFANVSFDEDENKFIIDQSKQVKLGDSLAKGWWTCKTIAPFQPFNLIETIEKAIKRATKLHDADMKRDTPLETETTLEDIMVCQEFANKLALKKVTA